MTMYGPHVDRVHSPKSGRPSITDHIRAARSAAAEVNFDARAFQIFIAGPRNSLMTLRPNEAEELRSYLTVGPAGSRPTVIAHGTYTDFPWTGKPSAVRSIRAELDMCARAGVAGLVVHLGKSPVGSVVSHLPQLLTAQTTTRLYLETPAVKPENSYYETPEKLAILFREIRRIDPDLCKFGLCVDTAHLWACGVNLQSFEDGMAWINGLEAAADVIPPQRLIYHLNDNQKKRGSGADQHSRLFQGAIWSRYADRPRQSGLAAFTDYINQNNLVAILERHPPEYLIDDYYILGRLTENATIYV